MTDHPLRLELNDELHSRAGIEVHAPSRISHVAFTLARNDPDPLPHIAALARTIGQPEPSPGSLHVALSLPEGTFRYERHGEFYRLVILQPGVCGQAPALALLPPGWLAELPGQRLVAIDTRVLGRTEPTPDDAELRRIFGHDDFAAAEVSQGKATVWTDFRIQTDGFTRMQVQDHDLTPLRLGRVIRRIHEIETYRMMALLALPVARSAQSKLAPLEASLGATIEGMPAAKTAQDDSELLQSLIRIARDVEDLSNSTNYRFSATRAYAALVERRIVELGEHRVRNHQRIGTYLDRRFSPAMATCNAVSARIDGLARRAERASNLLRTRVDIALEAQNQSLLRSMDQRARQQLILQETVEGLSVVAISYYLIGLVTKFAESLAGIFPWLNLKIIGIVSVPVTVGLVWLALRRFRRKFAHEKKRSPP